MFRRGQSGNVPIMQRPDLPILFTSRRMMCRILHLEIRQREARELPPIDQRVNGGLVRT